MFEECKENEAGVPIRGKGEVAISGLMGCLRNISAMRNRKLEETIFSERTF